jgi:hypothetical protein
MKKIFLFMILTLWNESGFSRAPVSGCRLIEDKVDEVIDHNQSRCLISTDNKIEAFKNFLNHDDTDLRDYVSDVSDREKWFICLHFSSQLFLRGSCFANLSDVPIYEEKTSLEIRNSSFIQKNHLPIFGVNMTNTKIKFFHEINAIFLGSLKSELRDIRNFKFVEPQSDIIFDTYEDLKGAYSELTNAHDLQISISLMDSPTISAKGFPQYRTRNVVKFHCSN